MEATIRTLHRFSGITAGNYKCHVCAGTRSRIEYTNKYTLIFLLRGSFRHASFRQSFLLTSELILFKKPGFEYEAIHEHYIHDDCFYIEFNDEVLQQLMPALSGSVLDFLEKKDVASLLLRNDPWKHYTAWALTNKTTANTTSLELQNTLNHLILSVLGEKEYSITDHEVLHDSIDKAKQFMAENFINDISINDIAEASHVSPFYFSRVFKRNTRFSPHQFLLEIRLNNACKLLLDSDLSVAHVGYSSGFSNSDYFVTLFKKKTGLTPTQFRSR